MRTIEAFVCGLFLGMTPVPGFTADTWHIKCFKQDGRTVEVKAISASGTLHDVKATQVAGAKFLDVRAIKANGETLPVKVVASRADRLYSDVKAISKANALVPVKVITATGSTLDVKAFYNANTGEYDIKCLTLNGRRLGIKAVSPDAQVYDVKGIKTPSKKLAPTIGIEADLKARPQRTPAPTP